MIGTIIGGGLSLLGGLLNRKGQKSSDDRNNAAALEQQRRANEHNVQFWNMQNQYNDPSQQMARLKKAGLNPNLIYGSPGAATAVSSSPISPSKAAPQRHSNLNSQLNMQDWARTAVQTDNMKQQTKNLQAQEGLINTEKGLKAAQTNHEVQKQGVTEKTKEYAERNMDAALLKSSADAQSADYKQQFEEETYGKRVNREKYKTDKAYEDYRNSFEDAELKEKTHYDRRKQERYKADKGYEEYRKSFYDQAKAKISYEMNANGIDWSDDALTRFLVTDPERAYKILASMGISKASIGSILSILKSVK